MNLLFVCSLNQKRSRTAEVLFSGYDGIVVRSAGTQSNARLVVGAELVEWADIIFVMEQKHHQKLKEKFPSQLQGKRVVCLDIEDEFEYMDPELVETLRMAVGPYLLQPV